MNKPNNAGITKCANIAFTKHPCHAPCTRQTVHISLQFVNCLLEHKIADEVFIQRTKKILLRHKKVNKKLKGIIEICLRVIYGLIYDPYIWSCKFS